MAESQTLKSFEHLNMEREKLLSSTNKYKRALENQVEDLKASTVKIAIQGLVFGGVALGSYLIVKAFQKKTPEAKNEATLPAKSSISSKIFASIQSYIASFLLSIAREKITQYLEAYLQKQNESSPKDRS